MGQNVALLCDVPSAMPPPVIEWVDGSGVIIADDGITTTYANEGQYLVLSELTPAQISRTYSCRVTNVRVHSAEESAGSYMLIDQGKLQSGSVMFLLLTGIVFYTCVQVLIFQLVNL